VAANYGLALLLPLVRASYDPPPALQAYFAAGALLWAVLGIWNWMGPPGTAHSFSPCGGGGS
jgi:hypothetical protein